MTNIEKVGVISPGFHIPRVEYLFQKAGVEILGIPSENILETRRPKATEKPVDTEVLEEEQNIKQMSASSYRNSDLYKREIRREMRVFFIQQHKVGRKIDDALARKRRDPLDEAQAA